MTDVDRFTAEKILTEASKLITEVRANEYGDSFRMTAEMWSSYLGVQISVEDFCIMMALMKVARAKCGKKIKDNFVDGVGYLGLAGSAAIKEEK
jgi:hypothetical protein